LIFVSPHANYQLICRPEIADMMMGYKRVVARELVADFGYINAPETYDEDGSPQAVIQGGTFDSVATQKRLGWSDEEREIVEMRLLELIQNPPDGASRGDVSLYEAPKPIPPWPTYDKTDYTAIADFAAQAGLVDEAITYEQRAKRRNPVLKALEAKRVELEGTEELVAQ
jgi:hypothetical protein